MKTIPNTEIVNKAGDKLKVVELALMVSRHVSRETGLSMEGQRKRNKLVDDLEAQQHEANIVLEDDRCDLLKHLVDSYPWLAVDPGIVEFGDIIDAAAKAPSKKATAAAE